MIHQQSQKNFHKTQLEKCHSNNIIEQSASSFFLSLVILYRKLIVPIGENSEKLQNKKLLFEFKTKYFPTKQKLLH